MLCIVAEQKHLQPFNVDVTETKYEGFGCSQACLSVRKVPLFLCRGVGFGFDGFEHLDDSSKNLEKRGCLQEVNYTKASMARNH